MKFFIIHGTGGDPNGNWFPWLKKQLKNQGHEVIIPKFPTPENQTLDNWGKVFDRYFDKVDSNTIFVGHSLAPAFILSILERIDVQIRACFFVAGFLGLLSPSGKEGFDPMNKTFTTRSFDWKKFKKHWKKFYVYNSDNDPYVPLEKGKELAQKLDSNLIKILGAGHINKEFGFTEFPRLLEDINKELN